MRRILRLMFLSAVVILLVNLTAYGARTEITQKDIDDGLSFCKDYPVFLQVDGVAVEADVMPVIIKERTLIPARAVFERMGAVVNWDENARLVEITMGTSNVKLAIDSNTAFVNGAAVTMDVPAMIIDSRTLIPVRFVAESLSFGVGWNDLSRTVLLTSPTVSSRTKINSVDFQDNSDYYRVVIQGEGVIAGYKSFAYDNPQRFGADLKNASLDTADDEVDAYGEIIKAVRFSQFDSDTVRVVIDLKEKVAGKVSYSQDKNTLFIDFDKKQADEYNKLGDVTEDGLAVVDWRATEKLVVIDPGHGGKDTGSQAIRDGVEILNEKDVNLDVALRLDKMLKAAGVRTYILRETDDTITLYERPALANAANGDLYVSIHNNSSVNPSARGVEVYYNAKINECDYGIYSKELANAVYEELVRSIGIPGRGAKSEPAYAVLNKTQMPAIIIEGAFLSNTEDLKVMMTDEFRQNYALAAAQAIIRILNESVEEK